MCRVVKFLLSLIPVRVILYESRVLTLSAELGVRERRRRTTDDDDGDDDASTNDDDGGDGNPSSGALRRMGTRCRCDDGVDDDARCRDDGSARTNRVRVESVSNRRGGDGDDERGAGGSARRAVDAPGANGGEARVEEGE